MAYHALLICADEKLTRIVSQLFFDIGFEMIASDAAGAAKAMADQSFDAIIADCGNEDTSLIFNGVRKSNLNRNSLTIALVDGQVGVAAAYRAGVNLVLTKPINIEQAKGTLRIARGLLKKNAENSGQGSTAHKEPSPGKEHTAVRKENAIPEFSVPVTTAAHTHDDPFFMAGTTAETRLEPEIQLPQEEMHQNVAVAVSALGAVRADDGLQDLDACDVAQPEWPAEFAQHAADLEVATKSTALARETMPPQMPKVQMPSPPLPELRLPTPAINELPRQMPKLHLPEPSLPTPAKSELPRPVVTGGNYSAAAAAPAREKTNQSETLPREATHISGAPAPAKAASAKSTSAKSGWTPLTQPIKQTLTPNVAADDSEVSINDGAAVSYAMPAREATGFSRIFIGVAIVLIVAAAGYFAWSRFGGKPAETPSDNFHVVGLNQPGHANSATEKIATITGHNVAVEKSSSGEMTPRRSTPAVNEHPASQGMGERIELVLQPKAEQPAISPLQVTPNTQASQKHAENEAAPVAPPSLLAVAEPTQNNLSALMSSDTNVSKPTLTQVRVSQGVSQGLLIKSVTPRYPQSALTAHRSGVVEIEATIDKEGHVVDPRVLNGNTVFNAPALEAVRQWRYKPYYLNGEPVEIRTQVTIRFKAD